MRRFLCN